MSPNTENMYHLVRGEGRGWGHGVLFSILCAVQCVVHISTFDNAKEKNIIIFSELRNVS
jgi:hypothetical protein